MRLRLFPVLLVFAALGLSSGAAYAQMQPGCYPEYYRYLANQGDAIRVRNKGYAVELISRNESTLRLTCFDQAMLLTGRLGITFFSDFHPAAPPPGNIIVFPSGLDYSGWGSQRFLARDIWRVMSNTAGPMYDNYLLNFPLPVPAPPPPLNKLTFVAGGAGLLQPIIVAIGDFQQSELPELGIMLGRIQEIEDEIKKLMGATLTSTPNVPDLVTNIRAIFNALRAQVADIIDNRRDNMPALLNAARDLLNGPQTEMLCSRIDDLWSAGNPSLSMVAPGRQDYLEGSPYFNLRTLVNVSPLPGAPLPGANLAFSEQLRFTAFMPSGTPNPNIGVLLRAWVDIGNLEPLPVLPPVLFLPNVTTAQIISAMTP